MDGRLKPLAFQVLIAVMCSDSSISVEFNCHGRWHALDVITWFSSPEAGVSGLPSRDPLVAMLLTTDESGGTLHVQ